MPVKREFVRLNTQLPLRYRVLRPAEYRREKARILTTHQDRAIPLLQLAERWASQDTQGKRERELQRLMVPVLATMHEKLDRILCHLNPRDFVALRFLEPRPVNLSGSGLGGRGELQRRMVPALAAMHEKLDRILFSLNPHDPVALRFEKPLPVNLSGSGLGLTAEEPLSPETTLALELLLPFLAPLVIKAIGRVSRVQPLDPEKRQWHIGIAFEVIHEEDREAIIRYISREQRIALRARCEPPTATHVEQRSAPPEALQ